MSGFSAISNIRYVFFTIAKIFAKGTSTSLSYPENTGNPMHTPRNIPNVMFF